MYSMDSPYNNDTTSLQSSGEELDHHRLDSSSFFPSPDHYTNTSNLNSQIEPNLMFLNTDPITTTPPAATPSRTPKKRSRASRRAPTTVLTTDTSNFRAMVQEFTGIPSPPFNSNTRSSSSPFYPSMSRFFNMESSTLGTNQQNFASMQNLGVQLRNDVALGGGGGGGYGGMDVGLMGLAGSGWALDGPDGFQPQYGSSDNQRN